MSTKHTPGPWEITYENSDNYSGGQWFDVGGVAQVRFRYQCTIAEGETAEANARLIAAAPELLEALKECIDAQWVIDSHVVEFDGTGHFGPYYDFSGLEGIDRHEFIAEYSCVVWPSNGKWSAYCTYDGATWFEAFGSADAAKETCMRLLDKVMPSHPAMKARAAIAKATREAP